jgi:hypothetical protein
MQWQFVDRIMGKVTWHPALVIMPTNVESGNDRRGLRRPGGWPVQPLNGAANLTSGMVGPYLHNRYFASLCARLYRLARSGPPSGSHL